MDIALNFYKNLFAAEAFAGVHLASDFWDREDLVSREGNEMLELSFSENEIKDAIFSCCLEGAPSPDDLPFLFYQKFWNVVKKDIIALFDDLFKGELDLCRLNFALVTLIPKVDDTSNMKQFRPIK